MLALGGQEGEMWEISLQKTMQMFLREGIFQGVLHRRRDKRMKGSCFVFFFQKDDECSAAAPLLLR